MERPPLSSLNVVLDSKSGVNYEIHVSFDNRLLGCFGLTLEDLCKEASYGSSYRFSIVILQRRMHRLGVISDLTLITILLPVFLSTSTSETETVAFKKKIYISI